jgi:TP901 family phage tail tape measure protein/lambda family phage tail tape measure protein
MFNLDLGNLLIHLKLDANQFEKVMQKAEGHIRNASRRMVQTGKSLSLYVTAPLLSFGAAATKSFADFDKAMTQSLAIMRNVTPAMRKEMEGLAINISKDSVKSAKELGAAYFYLASAGLDAQQSLNALRAVERFATAGAFDMSLATDLATDAQSALGLTVKDSIQNMKNMIRVTDVLVAANTLANATTQQFSYALTSQAGPAMKFYNVELEEGVAVLAAYADQGIKAQEAGTMFSRAMRLMVKGFQDNRDQWERFSVNIYDTNNELRPFYEIITDLTNAMRGLGTEQKVAMLDMLGFQARSQQAIMPLIGLGDKIKWYKDRLEEAGGTTERIAQDQMKAFSAQLKVTWHYVMDAGRAIGNHLAPHIGALGDIIRNATSWFTDLSMANQRIIVELLAIVAAVGPLVLSFGLLLKVIVGLTAVFATAASATAVTALISLLAGWRIGKWMYDEFDVAVKAYNKFAGAILKNTIRIKYEWKIMVAEMKNSWDVFLTFLEKAKIGMDMYFLDFAKTLEKVPGVDLGTDALSESITKRINDLNNKKMLYKEEANSIREEMEKAFADIDHIVQKRINIDTPKTKSEESFDSLKEMEKTFSNIATQAEQIKTQLSGSLFPKEIKREIDLLKEEYKTMKLVGDERESQQKLLEFQALVWEKLGKNTQEAAEAISVYREQLDLISKESKLEPIKQWYNEAVDVFTNISQLAADSIRSISREITQMVFEGKADFWDLAKSAAAAFFEIILNAQLARMASSMFPSLFGGGGGFSSAGGGEQFVGPPVPAPVMHGGGIVGGRSSTRWVPSGIFANAPRFHNGLAPDEFPSILQKGEMVIPKGAGIKPPNIIINNNSGKEMEQENEPQFDGENWVVSVVAKNIDNFGLLRQKMKGLS